MIPVPDEDWWDPVTIERGDLVSWRPDNEVRQFGRVIGVNKATITIGARGTGRVHVLAKRDITKEQ